MDSTSAMLQATQSVASATWGLFWATVALAVVGAIYAAFTLGILKEQVRLRKSQVEPVLAPRLRRKEHPFAHEVELSVMNYGQGAALGVNAVLHFQPGNLRYEVGATGIAAGENRVLVLPASGRPPYLVLDNIIKTDHDEMHLVGTCNDTTGEKHGINIRVPLREDVTFPAQAIVGEVIQGQLDEAKGREMTP